MTDNINNHSNNIYTHLEPVNSYHGTNSTESQMNLIDNSQERKMNTSVFNESEESIQMEQEDLSSDLQAVYNEQSGSHSGDGNVDDNSDVASGASGKDQDDNNQSKKRRNKLAKKNNKLDAKSKLEKSRQSARECRARKKLRYQYLEDLVCNREKAVVKLREELSTFCDYVRRIDNGTISSQDKIMLVEQTKENSCKST